MSANRLTIIPTEEIRPSARITPRDINVEGLEAELRKSIAGKIRFDAGSKALYATDGSNYRQVPIGVVVPKSREDVIQTVAACRKFGAPALSRGGGTSLAGRCCNIAVVMAWTKYLHKIVDLNPRAEYSAVHAGTI